MNDTAAPPIRWYFDVISPFAFLHWPKVKALAARQPVTFRPLLFAGLLDRLGQKGPAEIPGKREFTYCHTLWRARRNGIAMRYPPAHPFNPLPALRLCVAAGATPDAIDAILGWIWREGRAGDSPQALVPLAARLGIDDIATAIAAPAVKAALRENFEAAVADGVFGVPTLAIGDALFWGGDAHDFAEAVLADPSLLDDPEFRRVSSLPMAAVRGA